MRTITLALIPAILMTMLASCATPPSRIAATDYPDEAYAGKSCQSLHVEKGKVETDLKTLSQAQTDAIVGDTLGVVLIGVPIASLAGADRETQIAVAKGKASSLDRSMKAKGC